MQARPPRLQVLESEVVVNRPKGPKGEPLRVAECIVGDETATIVFNARNEQGRSWALWEACWMQQGG